MEGIAAEYFPNSIDHGSNEEKYEFHSYISKYNEEYACDTHYNMLNIYKCFDTGILLCGMSAVWEDTNGSTK